MQTFLPYANFTESAKCLDRQRLGKQRVEAWQILQALTIPNYGWKNHPAVKMWKGYELQLCTYGLAICNAWLQRGYKDTLAASFNAGLFIYKFNGDIPWLGNFDFHISHQSNLLRKNPIYYSKFNWNVPNNLPYIWPA